MLNKHNVQFICQSYNKINPDQNDFVYFDPPYAHVKGMYFGGFNNVDFFSFLSRLNCDYMFSYDGIANE